MTDLIDLMTSRSERDKGIENVALNNLNFMEDALHFLNPHQFRQSEFTGEDIRVFIEGCDVAPAHSNAWGALIMTAVKRGLIVPTGAYRSMKSKTSHARKTAVYKWA